MAFVLTWQSGIIQVVDGYDNIEEALVFLGKRKKDVMDLEYWEDTDGWKLFFPWEIDIDQLKA